jgi:hypothetical protein
MSTYASKWFCFDFMYEKSRCDFMDRLVGCAWVFLQYLEFIPNNKKKYNHPHILVNGNIIQYFKTINKCVVPLSH